MAIESPNYEVLNEEDTKRLLKLYKGERTGWVVVGREKWFFPYKYSVEGKGYYNFEARPDDIWVVTYPRSGTTWTQELIWLLVNDLDFARARTEQLTQRFPFLEYSMFHHPEVVEEMIQENEGNKEKQEFCKTLAEPGYEVVAKMPSKRFIKTHFSFSLIPNVLKSGCRVVYVARNPKDVGISWYYLNRSMKTQEYVGDFETFWDLFQNDMTPWSPYWKHLKEAWAVRDRPNVLFMFYDEMKHDFPKAIEKIAEFLGKTYTEEQIKTLTDYLDIKNFRNNPMVNGIALKKCGVLEEGQFVRQGVSGGWKDVFTPELNAKANKWIEENLKDTDLTFPYFDYN